MGRLKALVAHGLTGMDLIRCWATWRIQPLSPRTRLICTYSRQVSDNLRMTTEQAGPVEIERLVKKISGKMVKDQSGFGLSPFCSTSPPPAVGVLPLSYFLLTCFVCTY